MISLLEDALKLGTKLISKGAIGLGKKLIGAEKVEDITDTINSIGEKLGIIDPTPEKLDVAFDDPANLEKLIQYDLDLKKLENEDRSSAREMRKSTGSEFVDKLAMHIMKTNLPAVGILVIVNIIVLICAKIYKIDVSVVLAVGNVVGMVIGDLLRERREVTGFYLGSSIGSKLKDLKQNNK